jgi:hypothetical protein
MIADTPRTSSPSASALQPPAEWPTTSVRSGRMKGCWQEIHRGGNLVCGGAARARIIRDIAAALILLISSAGSAVSQPFRHQHGKAARDQKGGQRTVFRLRHLRATEHILRRRMHNHREQKRPGAIRAEQHSVRRRRWFGRGHQPLLQAVQFRFGARAPRIDCADAAERPNDVNQASAKNILMECMKRPGATASKEAHRTAAYRPRIKTVVILRGLVGFLQRRGIAMPCKISGCPPFRRQPVLFRYTFAEN